MLAPQKVCAIIAISGAATYRSDTSFRTHISIKGVIVDTSRDYSSPTYDFLSGNGINLPKPTSEEYARRLFAIAERLWDSGVLNSVIGNRTVKDNSKLREAMERFMPEQYEELKTVRVVELKSPVRGEEGYSLDSKVRSRIYLGYSKHDLFWLHTTEWAWRSIGPISCTILDLPSLIEIFQKSNRQLPHTLLRWLNAMLYSELNRQKTKLDTIQEQFWRLCRDVELFGTANSAPPPSISTKA